MGISIHYSGWIADKSKLPQLIEEVAEIATVHGWKYQIYEREFPFCSEGMALHNKYTKAQNDDFTQQNHDGKLYGIDISPKGSEPVSFCFLSNGRMSSIMQLFCWGKYDGDKKVELLSSTFNERGETLIDKEERTITREDFISYLYQCCSKTQYAGPEAHKMIIGIFRYIVKNYLADFTMIDEAQFWETSDENILKENFRRNAALIEAFRATLVENKSIAGEDVDTYIERIIQAFRRRKGK